MYLCYRSALSCFVLSKLLAMTHNSESFVKTYWIIEYMSGVEHLAIVLSYFLAYSWTGVSKAWLCSAFALSIFSSVGAEPQGKHMVVHQILLPNPSPPPAQRTHSAPCLFLLLIIRGIQTISTQRRVHHFSQ